MAKSISIDLAIILDPYKFMLVLSGLGKSYDEIYVPQSLGLIECWYPSTLSFTFDIFNEDISDIDNLFGYKTFGPENFCAGLRLLKRAEKEGMIKILPNHNRLIAVGRNLISGDRVFDELYINEMYPVVTPPGGQLTINPDLGPVGPALLGAEAELGIKPVYGNVRFVEYLRDHRINGQLFGVPGELEVDEGMKDLLEIREASSLDELWFYLKNRNIINVIAEKLVKARLSRENQKDMSITGLDLLSTLSQNNAVAKSIGKIMYQAKESIIHLHISVGTLTDQRGQHVERQYNAGGNINFNMAKTQADFILELSQLKDEAACSPFKDRICPQLAEACLQAQKPGADMAEILKPLIDGKESLKNLPEAAGLCSGLQKAIELAPKWFK